MIPKSQDASTISLNVPLKSCKTSRPKKKKK